MPFDFKKEYKAFYQPPKQPQIVTNAVYRHEREGWSERSRRWVL